MEIRDYRRVEKVNPIDKSKNYSRQQEDKQQNQQEKQKSNDPNKGKVIDFRV